MKNNYPFLISITFLVVSFLTSITAYLFIPDRSHNANDQHTEIALKPPGYKSNFLVSRDSTLLADQPVTFEEFIFGKKHGYSRIQYDTIVENDRVYIVTNHIGQKRAFLKTDYRKLNSSRTFWLGTDRFGRDLLSRIILGIRISLAIGFMAVFISLIIGITLGSLAGYYGKCLDQMIMYLVNVIWSVPTLLLVFVIVLILGRGLTSIFIAVGLTMWVDVARLVRGQVLSIRSLTYVKATKSLAYSSIRTIFKHILPNIIGPLFVIAASNFAIAILIEAGLSYLGFGIQPPAPSLGSLLNENYAYAISGKIYLAAFPAMMIMSLVLAFNILGSSLRDIFDVK